MKNSIRQRLETLQQRHEEIGILLSESEVINNQNRFRDLSKEYAQLTPIAECYAEYLQCLSMQKTSQELLQDNDLRELAKEELEEVSAKLSDLEKQLYLLLIPQDPNDDKNIYLEIRAGTGGDEAAIFAGDLARMYMRYAEDCHWSVQILSRNEGEKGGYREIIMLIAGQNVYSKLKFESGAHRVQRVPETESQGRIHTSACTVAVLPEVEEIDEVVINSSDLRIDTFRASGAGGQHVNKTDSAIRITHMPSGIVVECQDERSQHKNRARAMSLLTSKILAQEQDKQQSEQAATRKSLVGSGDRSERIRTYNYPQGRVTDHRINLTLYKLDDIMEGHLAQVIEPLIREQQAALLAEL